MPDFKADLSVSSLDQLLSDLKDYKKKVDAAPNKIAESLAQVGAESIQETLSEITNQDGNALGEVGIAETETGLRVYNEGSQIAFLEYGTGEQGAADSHPLAGKAGWKYGSGPKIRKMKNGKRMWRYWDHLRGHWRITNGIPAQMQVFTAAQKMRDRLVEIARGVLK